MKRNDATDSVLVDSDAFIGLFYEADAHHSQVATILEHLHSQRLNLLTTSLVILETATVLSHRKGQEMACTFLEWAANFPSIHITEDLQKEAISLFKAQTKKGSSVTDCANVVVMKRFGIDRIFSFDKVYPQKFGLKTAA